MGPLPYGDRPDQKDGSRKKGADMKLQCIKDILGDAYRGQGDHPLPHQVQGLR